MQITLRKANADRKAIDKKIDDIVNNIKKGKKSLIGFYQTVNPTIGTMSPEEYKQDITSTWQKLNDLIVERNKLNDVVMAANGGTNMETATLVEVKAVRSLLKTGETEKLTIAQAIARKKYIINTLLPLVAKLNAHVTIRVENYNRSKEDMQFKLMDQVNKQFGPESAASAKARTEYQDAISKNYEITLVDPIKSVDKMEAAKEFLEDYVTTIDSVISNATETTMVEVED